jgi:hypothetical protein
MFMTVRDTIVHVFTEVAQEQDQSLAALDDRVPLLDLGLDSLSIAIIVARLESSLGTDPFSAADEVDIPATFGEFVAVYETALV